MDTESALLKKISRIESLVDISELINKEANSTKQIQKYYRINDIAYKRFHSDKGFMHFRVTTGEELKDDDILYQPNVISEYIHAGDTVLELGSGQGANIKYIAEKHPDASFIGVDLYPKLDKSAPKNIKIYKQDYTNIPFIEDESIDVIYGIETIVHCSDKEKVFKEISRILKKGGILILYDYTLTKELEEFRPYEQTAIKIISKGGACALIESFGTWNKYIKATGFTEIKTSDLHKEILPDLKRLAKKADKIMKSDKRVKLFMHLMPKTFANNLIVGWIGYDAGNEGVGYYSEWIYKK